MNFVQTTVTLFILFILWRFLKREPRYDLNGKNILITGGTSGIGLALAKKMLNRYAIKSITIWGREDQSNKLCQEILLQSYVRFSDTSPTVRVMLIDVCNNEDVQIGAQTVLKELGHIDVIVNNAGIVYGKSFVSGDLDDEMCLHTINTNAVAHLRVVRAFLPSMKQRGSGFIVSVLSTMSFGYASCLADYCASKWAALAYLHCLRFELKCAGYRDIHVMGICPFLTKTNLFDGALEGDGDFFLRRFFFPTLEVEDVAAATIHGIEQRKELLALPRFLWYLYYATALLPIRLQDHLTALCGGAQGMKNFRGKAFATGKGIHFS